MPIELISGIEVVNNLPLVYIRKYKALILADTHIGYEEDMAEKGIFIPSFQLRNVMEVINEAFNLVDVDKVIIAGDLKHKFDSLGRQERRELSRLLTELLTRVDELIVVRGNHDNFLPLLQRKFNFKIVNEYLLGDMLIIHGHKDLRDHIASIGNKWKVLIMGHEHPSITLRDELGVVGRFPCFLLGGLRNLNKSVLVLPAVGAYQTGSKVTLSPDTYLSPVIRDEVNIGEIRPVIVDREVGVMELPPLKYLFDLI